MKREKRGNGARRSSNRSSGKAGGLRRQVALMRSSRERAADARRREIAASIDQHGPVHVTLTEDDIQNFGPGEEKQFREARTAIVIGAAEHDISEALYLYKCADIVTRMINDKEEPRQPKFVWIARILRANVCTHLHPGFTFPEYALWEKHERQELKRRARKANA